MTQEQFPRLFERYFNSDCDLSFEGYLRLRVLRCPMNDPNPASAATVGEYLSLLLSTLWLQGEGFNSKRPFGDSGWEWEVYAALINDGIAEGRVDEDGYIAEFSDSERYKIDELILQIIQDRLRRS